MDYLKKIIDSGIDVKIIKVDKKYRFFLLYSVPLQYFLSKFFISDSIEDAAKQAYEWLKEKYPAQMF